jgi:hypothetical protein
MKQVRETSYLTILLIQTLENAQRRAARFVINDYTSRTQGCVTNMLTSLRVADFRTMEEDNQTRFDVIHTQKSWVVCSFTYPRWRFVQARNFYKDFLKKYFVGGCGHFSEVKYLTLHR